MFINQAKNAGMYKERKYNPKHNVRKQIRHGKQVRYIDECEVLLKNSLRPDNTSDKQYQEYAEQINIYKKLVYKTKKMHIKTFHKKIRNLKTRNSKEFGKIIQS